ncbi:MAG TPA: GHMP kinase, partial [Candidatus Lokiarchaeia archaeon]|nr:GHMP kinase [Candidatus Lokiarchaeia archaeon]
FRKDLLEERGYGEYERLDPALLPSLYVAYQVWTPEGKSSEVVHNDIRQRYDAGEALVIETMDQIADCAREGRKVLVRRDYATLEALLDQNYDLRASMYNIASQHKAMVALARSIGATAQFAGSGGAIVGTYQDESMFVALQDAFREINCEVIKPTIT